MNTKKITLVSLSIILSLAMIPISLVQAAAMSLRETAVPQVMPEVPADVPPENSITLN